jgi:hypothetical protein
VVVVDSVAFCQVVWQFPHDPSQRDMGIGSNMKMKNAQLKKFAFTSQYVL